MLLPRVSALACGVVNKVPWVAGESGNTAVELVSADCGSEPIVNSGIVVLRQGH